MATEITNGNTTTDGTEQTLATDTTNKTYVFTIQTNNMVNGDIVEIRIKTKVRSGSTEYQAYYALYAHAQANPNKFSIPVPANNSCKVTLKRTAGTDRAYEWALLSL